MQRMGVFVFISVVILGGWLCAGELDVALTVEERAGVRRAAEPVAGGVPLPRGLIKDVSKLRLLDDRGREVPAQFTKLAAWHSDGSVRWVLVEFLADLGKGSLGVWRLKSGGQGSARTSYLKSEKTAAGVTVDTGKIKFTVKSAGFNLFDKVWLDETGKRQYDDDHLVASGGGDLIVTNNVSGRAEYTSYRASEYPNTSVELEESGPVRTTIKVRGAHGAGDADGQKALNYTLRIHAYNDKSYLRLVYTAECRQGALNSFVPVDRWTVKIAPDFSDELMLKYSFGTQGAPVNGDMGRRDRRAFLYADSSDHYFLGGRAYHGSRSGVLEGRGKSTKPFNLGWADLSGATDGVTVGVRYFWQLWPKALEVNPKGVQLHLWPNFATRPGLVSGEYGERRARFFAGVSKTHEILVYFHGQKPDLSGAWAFLQKPLFAQCPPAWYCQGTRVLGRLVDAAPASFKPEFRNDVRRFDRHMRKSLESLLKRRDFNRGRDGYGMFNFGDHINYVDEERRDKYGELSGGPNVHWDNNYYRFPHLMFLQFMRTGDLAYFDLATEANAHLADVDSVCWPQEHAGAARYCAGPDHVRFVGEHLRAAGPYASNTFNHFKIESHFHRYHLTGDRRALEAGLRGAKWALRHGRRALSQQRSVGHGVFALLAGYRATGDKKYLQAAKQICTVTRKGIGAGIAADGARSFYEVTGDEKARGHAVNMAREFLSRAKDRPGIVGGDAIQAVAFAYGRSGDEKFLDATVQSLRKLVEGGPARDVHGFALSHSGVHYALWFLTNLPRDEEPVKIDFQP